MSCPYLCQTHRILSDRSRTRRCLSQTERMRIHGQAVHTLMHRVRVSCTQISHAHQVGLSKSILCEDHLGMRHPYTCVRQGCGFAH